MKIVVASQNPVKQQAVQEAFAEVFPGEHFEIEGAAVESGVSDQPMSDAETFQGASNRALAAKAAVPGADYYVGLEGGAELYGVELTAFAWMVIIAADGRIGKGKTSTVFLPPKVSELILGGKELGEADDIVFGVENSKQAGGSVGLLTDGIITRTGYYREALILALVPFKKPELYS